MFYVLKASGDRRRATGDVRKGAGSGVRGRTLLCGYVPFRPCGTRMLVTYYVTAQLCGFESKTARLQDCKTMYYRRQATSLRYLLRKSYGGQRKLWLTKPAARRFPTHGFPHTSYLGPHTISVTIPPIYLIIGLFQYKCRLQCNFRESFIVRASHSSCDMRGFEAFYDEINAQ
jgi:hypothetical protein